MNMNKYPKAFSRSEKAFIEALYTELRSKNFESIRVVDLFRLSGYTRGAFYSKFNDKYHFCEEMLEKLARRHFYFMEKYAKERAAGADFKLLLKIGTEQFSFIYENRYLYELIIDNKTDLLNCDNFIDQSIRINSAYGSNQKIPSNVDGNFLVYIWYYESLLAVKYWRKTDYAASAEQMALNILSLLREEYFSFPESGKFNYMELS